MVAADPMLDWAISKLNEWTRENVGELTPDKGLFGAGDPTAQRRWDLFVQDTLGELARLDMVETEIEEYQKALGKLYHMINADALDEYLELSSHRIGPQFPELAKALPTSFTTPQWILERLDKWISSNEKMTAEDLSNDKTWLQFVSYLDKKVLRDHEKVTPQNWFDYREALSLIDQARTRGELPGHLPEHHRIFTNTRPMFEEQVEGDEKESWYEYTPKSEVVEEAEKLINPKTLLDKYRVALRLQNYEEAGRLWKQMSELEQEEARKLATHRRTIRKLAFNDMLGKGWDSGKQYSYCMQRSLEGDPQFWWVPEVIRKFPMPPPNWEAVRREPDGRFKEFPGRGKGKKKKEKEKKSAARAQLCKFALGLYFDHHVEEGRRILSLLREIR